MGELKRGHDSSTERDEASGAARGSSPLGPGAKTYAIQVRAGGDWKEWLRGFAEKRGVGVAELLEEAVSYYAYHLGYPRPPRR